MKTVVLIRWAYAHSLLEAYTTAVPAAEQALAMAQALGLRDLEADALLTVAGIRSAVDPEAALAACLRALEIANEAGAPAAILRSFANAADALANWGGDLERCFDLQAKGLQAARRFGVRTMVRGFEGERIAES